MRISKEIRQFIVDQVRSLSPEFKVYLFGSRVDDNKRGGDIDILVLGNKRLSLSQKLDIMVRFNDTFGEQKLDLASFSYTDDNPFKKVALLTAKPILI